MSKSRLGALDLDEVFADSDAPTHSTPASRGRILEGIPAESTADSPQRAVAAVPAAEPQSSDAIPFPANRERPRAGAMANFESSIDRMQSLNVELAELKARLENGQVADLLDADLVDPSPFPDRLETTFKLSAYETLKESIRNDGQDQPILVRPHPEVPGRYQVAYGHRRRRACIELGLRIKAIVQDLSDEQMIAAQRRENYEREQPSYIERVFQIGALRDAGYTQVQISSLVGVTQSLISAMLQTRLLGLDLVKEIGPCPKSGRRAWESLQDLVVENGLRERAMEILAQMKLEDGDERLGELVRLLRASEDENTERARDIVSHRGVTLGHFATKPRSAVLAFKGMPAREFCEWLYEQMPDLHRRYLSEKG